MTEDDEIAADAQRCGAYRDRRAPALATDAAMILHVCSTFDREAIAGRQWQTMACLLATAPMRTAEDIRRTVALIEPGRCGFAVAVAQYDHAPHQALKLAADGDSVRCSRLVERRANELPPLRASNGTRMSSTWSSSAVGRPSTGQECAAQMPRHRWIDIDTADDPRSGFNNGAERGCGVPIEIGDLFIAASANG